MSTPWRPPFSSSMRWRCRNTSPLVGVLVAAAAIAIAIACASPTSAPKRVLIPPGTTFRAAADSLASAGVIGTPRLFGLYAKITGQDRAIKPGTYLLPAASSWGSTLEAMTHGRGLIHTITIPEGWEVWEIEPALSRSLGVSPDSVAAAVRDSALLAQVGAPPGAPTLEGFLFPDTYTFPDGTTAHAAVAEMVREFVHAWRPEWNARVDSLGLTRYQVVTLASIVEKEARVNDERPIIAAVYLNRLRRHMPLQADPTVQYALGHHVERVLYKNLDVDSPYNTYRHPGLPPGPIASPGAASLAAAVAPADVSYLYFVARPDGHHEFTDTFSAHKEARRSISR